MKSLVVDDDVTCGAIYQLMLSKFGECDIASTGLAAISAFTAALDKEQPYNLMLIDIMMPDISGYDVLQSVRLIEKERGISFPFNTKIILTTALDDEENQKIARALNIESEAYVVKASYPDALVDKLEAFGFDLSE